MHLNELAKLMRTAGETNRLRILCVLFRRPGVCVSDIADELGESVATVSHHLGTMAREGLLVPVRHGKRVCYTLPEEPFVADLKKFICKYR